METLIIQRIEAVKKDTSINLPYYASFDYFGMKRHVAIYGKASTGNVDIFTVGDSPSIGSFEVSNLPEDHTPISEAAFMEAFDTAIGRLQSKLRRVETI